jgi:hypothetical protein
MPPLSRSRGTLVSARHWALKVDLRPCWTPVRARSHVMYIYPTGRQLSNNSLVKGSRTQLFLEPGEALGVADHGELAERLGVVIELSVEEIDHAVHIDVLPPGCLLTR